jgi:catechol 2,3-dioxygenase-like lactoylglutathione lyase family enzyme
MIKVDGIGGVFINANDVKAMVAWYSEHFGLTFRTFDEGKVYGLEFFYRADDEPSRRASTVFAIHAAPSPLPAERREVMINYRVLDLGALLDQLRAAGIPIEKTEDHEYGRFAWIRDPEGNRIELYQPLMEPGAF